MSQMEKARGVPRPSLLFSLLVLFYQVEHNSCHIYLSFGLSDLGALGLDSFLRAERVWDFDMVGSMAAKAKSFRAVLEKGTKGLGWTIARLPFDPASVWKTMIRLRVAGEINGFPFST